jgi:hypothetical protein
MVAHFNKSTLIAAVKFEIEPLPAGEVRVHWYIGAHELTAFDCPSQIAAQDIVTILRGKILRTAVSSRTVA